VLAREFITATTITTRRGEGVSPGTTARRDTTAVVEKATIVEFGIRLQEEERNEEKTEVQASSPSPSLFLYVE